MSLIFGSAMIAVLCTLVPSAPAQTEAPPPISVKPLNENVYWVQGGAGANAGFIVGTNGVIVIDAKMTPESGKEMLAEIAKITPKPVTHVILTHSDMDHVNGLAGFPKGLTIIAQENCRKEMEESENGPSRQFAAPRDYLPTQTVAKNESITIDGVHLRLLYFGPAHTSGDLIIYLPDQRIVFTGDILTLQFPYPLVHLEKNGSSGGWIANMKGITALNADAFVPGHGDVQTKDSLQKKLADTQERRTQIKKLVAQGKSLDDAKIALGESIVPIQDDGYHPPTFTEVVYKETSSKLPFDPHDLTGVWKVHQRVAFSLSNDPPPMTPWAQAKYDAAKPGLSHRGRPLGNDPIMICDPMGYPRILFWNGYPLEVIRTPNRFIMFFDWFYTYRTIWTDGRKFPDDLEPRWYGNSLGHWEGDTFVVESSGFDERSWLDADGHPHSDEMRLEERYHRVDHDTIELTMTLTDPKAYTKPWVSEKKTLDWEPTELREDVCVPSVEAKYKDLIRDPAGGATSDKEK
jgi:glyoxylase-like metal-dependent hydrolase (beta-lactamase superfamily II)